MTTRSSSVLRGHGRQCRHRPRSRARASTAACAGARGARGRSSAGTPGTASSCSREAASTASGEPKCLSSARLRVGPMPGRPSRIDSVIARSRRVRWWVIAKRCASSRTRCSSWSSGVSWRQHAAARGGPGGRPPRSAWPARRPPRRARGSPAARAARAELARPAVDDDQVRQRRERLVALGVVRREVLLALPLRQAPAEHLLHRREVVGHALGRPADVEAPVVGLLRRAALEDDHRRGRVRAHEVRDVEALDAQRERVEPQRGLQAVERLDALLAAALDLQPLGVERELRVALGEVEDAALVAALGAADLDAAAAALGRAARRAPGPRRGRR